MISSLYFKYQDFRIYNLRYRNNNLDLYFNMSNKFRQDCNLTIVY